MAMSEDQAPYEKLGKSKASGETAKRLRKKSMVISDDDTKRLKLIAEKAKKMRIEKNMSYEEFAIHAGINRISYYRFEKSTDSGDKYSVALLMKVIRGLGSTPSDFFKDIK
jgi:DNA-binding XRE family transcriptional regulator